MITWFVLHVCNLNNNNLYISILPPPPALPPPHTRAHPPPQTPAKVQLNNYSKLFIFSIFVGYFSVW